MIFAGMFETVNSQFVFIMTFFVGSEVREMWYGKLVACSWTCSINWYTALPVRKKLNHQKYCLYVKGSHGL